MSVRVQRAALAICFLITAQWAMAEAATPGTPSAFKKGLLPDGGSYVLYDVQCPQGEVVQVASLDSRSRWCVARQGDLTCFRRQEGATQQACAANTLAASGGSADLSQAEQAEAIN